MPLDTAARGTAMVLVATLAWSFAGLFTRMLSIDVWTTVPLRALAGSFMLFVPMLMQRRSAALRDLIAIGHVGWVAVVLSAIAQAATTAALFLTSVAHVTVIYATCPFIAAVIARLWLGEVIPRATLVAIIVSIGGVVMVVAGSTGASSLVGDAVALLMTITFAVIIVLSKAHPDLKVLEVTILSAFLTFVVFMPFARADDLNAYNLAIVFIYSFTNMVLAFFLFIRGARHIPAATSGLIVTLEIALSPFWVWLFFNETIDRMTFVGGVIIALAVVGHLLYAFAQRRRALVILNTIDTASMGMADKGRR